MFTYIRKNKESKIYKIPILRKKFWERPYYFDISKKKLINFIEKVEHKMCIRDSYYSYNEDKLIRYINSNDEQIEYEYDKLNNVQSINYRDNQYQRTYDYFYDYETTNKTITSYFNKLNEKYQNEIVLAGKTGNGMYGLYQKENTAKINSEKNYDTYVFKDKYDSISYDLDTANVNRANNDFKS